MTLDSVSHCGAHCSYKASRLVSGTHGTFWLIRGYKPKMVDDGGFSDLWQKWQPAVGSVDEQCVWDTAMTFEASLADRKFNPSWTDWRWLETSKSAIFSFGQHFQALKILKKTYMIWPFGIISPLRRCFGSKYRNIQKPVYAFLCEVRGLSKGASIGSKCLWYLIWLCMNLALHIMVSFGHIVFWGFGTD